ncbi:hypothetical protein J7E89_39140 [Streptomyces sp. ISL-100]|nr:hypothetical protein [Streptomyces sp. ISL-100]
MLDILWVVASFEHGVEHLHVNRPETGGLGHLTFFIKATTQERAVALAHAVTCRALENSPALSGWCLAPGRL